MKKQLMMAAVAATLTSATAQEAPQLRADNIDVVLKAMTLEEKAHLLVGGAEDFATMGAVGGAQARQVPGAAGSTKPIDRLGIPATLLPDGPAGVRIDPTREGDSQTYHATAFPIGTCLASTWNTELVGQVGAAIGNETKEYRCDVLLGPGMNIHRNPLCGRNFEYYSEDPLVTGRIAAAYINGVQGQGAGVSAKHFAVNSQETDRTGVDERVTQRALREIYLRGFEMAVRESQPWTVMSSYNRINGEYAMCNHDLLTKVLRDDWGYQGIVITDWIGIRPLLPTVREVQAGNDIMMPGQRAQVQDIINGVKNGTLAMADVDRNVRRILEYIVKTPSFNKYPYTNRPDLKAHAAITRQTAAEGIVLLKNNGALPWTASKAIKTVALFGENSYDFFSGGTGSGCVHPPYVVDMLEGLKNAGISSTKTLTDIYQKYIAYAHAKFQAERHPAKWFQRDYFGQQKYPEIGLHRRLVEQEASQADAAIITIGRQAGEGIDRDIATEFNLVPEERALISDVCNAFHAAGKPVIVVINSGSVIETASWNQLPDAILCAWQPGMEGGNSIADIITGQVCPSGRLTMTWPVAATDHASTRNFPLNDDYYLLDNMKNDGNPMAGHDFTNHEEDIYVGYRFFDSFQRPVVYPFGYGLSYTTFEFSKPTAKVSGDEVTIAVTLKNTGTMAGKEVAQVYVAAPEGRLEKPVKELKAFAKTRTLQPGESQTLTMQIPVRLLASFDEQGSQWLADAGTYQVLIGASVADIRATTQFRLSKDYTEATSNALQPHHPFQVLSRK
jgi:beta-glucosidase